LAYSDPGGTAVSEIAASQAPLTQWIKPQFSNLVHRHEQMARIVEERAKPELEIEGTGGVVDGIHFDSSNAELDGNVSRATQSVETAKSLTDCPISAAASSMVCFISWLRRKLIRASLFAVDMVASPLKFMNSAICASVRQFDVQSKARM